MRHPRPATIKVQGLDGESRSISVDPKLPWIQVAQYISSLDPEAIECVDAEGRILRGIPYADLEDAEEQEETTLATVSPTPQLAARMAAPSDPQSAQLVLFAQLLADAYRHTTDVAFDKMISLFEQVNKRYETTEKTVDRLHRTVERLTEQRIERAASEPDDLTLSELAQAWSSGRDQGEAPPPAAPAAAPARREPPPPGYHPHNGKTFQ